MRSLNKAESKWSQHEQRIIDKTNFLIRLLKSQLYFSSWVWDGKRWLQFLFICVCRIVDIPEWLKGKSRLNIKDRENKKYKHSPEYKIQRKRSTSNAKIVWIEYKIKKMIWKIKLLFEQKVSSSMAAVRFENQNNTKCQKNHTRSRKCGSRRLEGLYYA